MNLNFNKFNDNRGYTGKILESDYFGSSVIKSPEAREFLAVHGSPAKKGGESSVYLQFKKSIEFIKKFYAQDPHNPAKPAANFLFQALAKKLNIDPVQLSFYSAIDTPLDKFHGIDGFFELENIRISLDVTANPKKEDTDENSNVDVVLHELPDPTKEPAEFTRAIDSYAQELTRVWNNKKRLAENEKRWSTH